MKQKLYFGKYPYTYARVSVMRASLLDKEDYHKLIKMSLHEIISFLQNSQYKQAIDALGVKYSGVDLMEMALNANLVNTWNKLKHISPKEVDALITAYLARADLWNIKTILRGLHTNTAPEIISGMLLPAGLLTKNDLEIMIKSESAEEILKRLAVLGVKFEALASGIETLKTKQSLVDIENALDKTYYKKMLEFAKRIPNEGKLFRQFLEAEINNTDVINILRLKRAGTDKHTTQKYVMGKLTPHIKKLLELDNKEEIGKILSHNAISEKAINDYITTNSLVDVEIELGKNLLKKTRLLLHQHPLTVDVILGYMFAKEIEIKNLKMMLKSRQLNLGDEFIEQQIVI